MRFLLALIVIGFLFYSCAADCAWCYSGECYSDVNCGPDCLCMKRGLDMAGQCYPARGLR